LRAAPHLLGYHQAPGSGGWTGAVSAGLARWPSRHQAVPMPVKRPKVNRMASGYYQLAINI
jgi:hypothetical protein